jgi:hypothetical protein
VWFEEWYDGPTTGVAEYEGQRYWFTPMAEDWHRDEPRRWVLRRLTSSEEASLDQRIADCELLSPDEYWSRYHSAERGDDGYEAHDGEVIGWFTAPFPN